MARGDGNRDRVGEALDSLAADTSRRGFLARVGAGMVGLAFGGAIADALNRDADAYTNFCGHTYTTGSCIHPYGLPRIDSKGYPLRPNDGRRVAKSQRISCRRLSYRPSGHGLFSPCRTARRGTGGRGWPRN